MGVGGARIPLGGTHSGGGCPEGLDTLLLPSILTLPVLSWRAAGKAPPETKACGHDGVPLVPQEWKAGRFLGSGPFTGQGSLPPMCSHGLGPPLHTPAHHTCYLRWCRRRAPCLPQGNAFQPRNGEVGALQPPLILPGGGSPMQCGPLPGLRPPTSPNPPLPSGLGSPLPPAPRAGPPP